MSPMLTAAAFASLLNGHAYLRSTTPDLAAFLSGTGSPPSSVLDHYLYWSVEEADAKLVTSVTHLTITGSTSPDAPLVMVLGKQVLATHYFAGSLNLLALCGGTDGPRYLLTINRSRLDLMRGPFRAFIRNSIERRIRGAAPDIMADLKRRVEARR
jgi:hypothetical protein